MLACAPLLLCSVLIAAARDLPTMTAGRLLGGVGVGLTSSVVPVYISEVAPTKLRGTFGTGNQLLICLGNLGAVVLNALVPAEHWRWLMALSAVPALALLAGMGLVCPESPRWLMHHRRGEEAAAAAAWLWGAAAASELEVRPSIPPTLPHTCGGMHAPWLLPFPGQYRDCHSPDSIPRSDNTWRCAHSKVCAHTHAPTCLAGRLFCSEIILRIRHIRMSQPADERGACPQANMHPTSYQ